VPIRIKWVLGVNVVVKANVRTTERVAVILFLVLLLMVVYQNCGMPVKMTDNMVHKLGAADLNSLQDLEPSEKQTLCESAGFYSCDHRIFSPETQIERESSYTKCSDLLGNGERFCAMVTMRTENGPNQTETIVCHNHMIREGQTFPVAAQSKDLDQTLSQAIASCRDILNY
jgi:hypothetical protein